MTFMQYHEMHFGNFKAYLFQFAVRLEPWRCDAQGVDWGFLAADHYFSNPSSCNIGGFTVTAQLWQWDWLTKYIACMLHLESLRSFAKSTKHGLLGSGFIARALGVTHEACNSTTPSASPTRRQSWLTQGRFQKPSAVSHCKDFIRIIALGLRQDLRVVDILYEKVVKPSLHYSLLDCTLARPLQTWPWWKDHPNWRQPCRTINPSLTFRLVVRMEVLRGEYSINLKLARALYKHHHQQKRQPQQRQQQKQEEDQEGECHDMHADEASCFFSPSSGTLQDSTQSYSLSELARIATLLHRPEFLQGRETCSATVQRGVFHASNLYADYLTGFLYIYDIFYIKKLSYCFGCGYLSKALVLACDGRISWMRSCVNCCAKVSSERGQDYLQGWMIFAALSWKFHGVIVGWTLCCVQTCQFFLPHLTYLKIDHQSVFDIFELFCLDGIIHRFLICPAKRNAEGGLQSTITVGT